MQSSLSMPTERTSKPSAWRSSSLYGYWKNRYLTLLLLPAIIYFIVFHYVPVYGIQTAFRQYRFMDGISGSPWAGLEHFRYLFSLDSFWLVLRNTLILSLLKFANAFVPWSVLREEIPLRMNALLARLRAEAE